MQISGTELIENFITDAQYSGGSVVIFGGTKQITVTGKTADTSVAGVVSRDPGLTSSALAAHSLPVVLRGVTQVNVIGLVNPGDLLVTSYKTGFAQSVGANQSYGSAVFAKALTESTVEGENTIYAVVI